MVDTRRELIVFVPVLGRPGRVVPFLESLRCATPEPHRVLFIADSDDEAEIDALEAADADYFTIPPPANWAQKINEAYRRTSEPWMLCAADDIDFHWDWFSRALRWLERNPNAGVIGTNDLCNARVMTGVHSTHPLVRRSYVDEHGTIDEEGKVLHEGYAHEYADDELVETAKSRGAYVHAFDAIVEHLHPDVGKSEMDETYRLGRAHSRRSRQLFRRRQRLWATRPPGQERSRPPRPRTRRPVSAP